MCYLVVVGDGDGTVAVAVVVAAVIIEFLLLYLRTYSTLHTAQNSPEQLHTISVCIIHSFLSSCVSIPFYCVYQPRTQRHTDTNAAHIHSETERVIWMGSRVHKRICRSIRIIIIIIVARTWRRIFFLFRVLFLIRICWLVLVYSHGMQTHLAWLRRLRRWRWTASNDRRRWRRQRCRRRRRRRRRWRRYRRRHI